MTRKTNMARKRSFRRGIGNIRADIIKRIFVYGVVLILLAALQCSFFARLVFLETTPDLILAAVIAILILDSQKSATVCAIAGGFIIDAVGGIGASFSPIYYLLTIMIVGLLSEKMLKSLPVWIFLMIPSILIRSVYVCVRLRALVGNFSIADALVNILFPEAICTVIVGIAVYFLIRLCMLLLKDRRDRTHV